MIKLSVKESIWLTIVWLHCIRACSLDIFACVLWSIIDLCKGRKKVEVLLQQMFEGEIDPEDEGPENETDIYVDKGPRRLTLDTVA